MREIKGFTLLEILILLLLITVAVIFAIPSYQTIILRNQEAQVVDQLISAIQFTRNQAIIRKKYVNLCPSKNQNNCSENWQDGLLIYLPRKNVHLNSNLKLKYFPMVTNNCKIIWNRSKNLVQMSANGSLSSQNGSFTVCVRHQNVYIAKKITLSLTGRVRMSEGKCE